jgi:hypothetical protein
MNFAVGLSTLSAQQRMDRPMRRAILIITGALLAWSAPASAADKQAICPDRPTKSTGPCTVPEGKWQIETGLIDWSRDKSEGVTTDNVAWGQTAIKYGLGPKVDVELWLAPLLTEHVHGAGSNEHRSSFGDTLVRVKYELTSDNAPVQVAIDPFVKIPTANHEIGNGKVEGGLVVPVQVPLGTGPLTLSLDPELDWVANEDTHGRHLATQQVVNLGLAATEKLNLSMEVWAMWDLGGYGGGDQVSFDGAVAYLVSNDVQLDAGANAGLNRQTPNVEIYTGVSIRF